MSNGATIPNVHRALTFFLSAFACAPQSSPRALQPPAERGGNLDVDPLGSASEAEQHLFALINAERASAGLPALAWNGRLALSAHERSIAMSRAAASKTGIQAETDDRVRRLRLATSVFVENDARAPTVDDAHKAWMANARQRSNILSTVANEVGVGVTVQDDATFAAEFFIHLGPKIDPARVARSLRDSLPSALTRDPDLASIAQESADNLAAGKSSDEVLALETSRIREIERRYAKLHHTITGVADVADVDVHALLGGFPADDVGVGVAQGTHPELGDGAVWIVVMTGEKLHSSADQPAP